MDDKVLVAYATKYGATAEIAGRLGWPWMCDLWTR